MLAFSALTLQPENTVDLVLQQPGELLGRGKLELCHQSEVWLLATEGNCTGLGGWESRWRGERGKKETWLAFGIETCCKGSLPFVTETTWDWRALEWLQVE